MNNNSQQPLPRIAYFCMEYGLHEKLPIYAGGLGILAGDHLKAAQDNRLPVVGIGILWRQDYTEQFIGQDGRPYDVFPTYDFQDIKETGITVKVQVKDAEVTCKVHLVDQYGNAPLYLLDTSFPGSKHPWITSRLYGGQAEDRIAAEIVLGIGGIRALRALGMPVDVYHFNEGHAVLAGLELIREKIAGGMSFHAAWEAARQEVVFTTHTPIAAGNEIHEIELLQQMAANNGLTYEQMKEIGGDPFNMTVAALRLSRIANGVSKAHGATANRMWHQVEKAAPIIAITNGVHVDTWQAKNIHQNYKNNGDLWAAHQTNKKHLLEFIAMHTKARLNPDALLVGFARRAAPYKRSDLIFHTTDVIEPLLNKGKLQLVFSGKAHPYDGIGKDIIKQLVLMDRKYADNVTFIQNYNMEVARLMVQGCDIWLNNPRRPMEASGTSGMKAALNGVLNISIVDGWVGEGIQHHVSGWLLNPAIKEDAAEWEQDAEDLKELYHVLINEVIPTYYQGRDAWITMMRAAITMALERFSSDRMLREYYEQVYQKTPGFQTQGPVISDYSVETRPGPVDYQPVT
ncbi:MAG: alpha-glucan family phosphorylase [Heliobacteriaceae bacterium]|nr:alpha-glucan family phosphorylase [Heliobacteriaceae bacterium]